MTLIEEHADDALQEVIVALRNRAERWGHCQISSKTIRLLIAERVGVPPNQARWVSDFVEKYLLSQGLIRLWSKRKISNGWKTVYTLVPERLLKG